MDVVPTDSRETAEPLDGVQLTQLVTGETMSIQHFRIDPGATVEVHDHHHEQLGYLISGQLTFIADDETVAVEPGDSYAIASHEPHGVENTGEAPAVGIEIFSPPRPTPPWLE